MFSRISFELVFAFAFAFAFAFVIQLSLSQQCQVVRCRAARLLFLPRALLPAEELPHVWTEEETRVFLSLMAGADGELGYYD